MTSIRAYPWSLLLSINQSMNIYLYNRSGADTPSNLSLTYDAKLKHTRNHS